MSRRSFVSTATRVSAGAALGLAALPGATTAETVAGMGPDHQSPPIDLKNPHPAHSVEELRAHWRALTDHVFRSTERGVRLFGDPRPADVMGKLAEDPRTGTANAINVLMISTADVCARYINRIRGETDDPGAPERESKGYPARLTERGLQRVNLTREDMERLASVWVRAWPANRRTWGEFAERHLDRFLGAPASEVEAELERLGFDLDAEIPAGRKAAAR